MFTDHAATDAWAKRPSRSSASLSFMRGISSNFASSAILLLSETDRYIEQSTNLASLPATPAASLDRAARKHISLVHHTGGYGCDTAKDLVDVRRLHRHSAMKMVRGRRAYSSR